ncbi:glycoprotein hormone alpha-2 [Phyllostomus hastatus]|uniref:glycoprotein hormone alpha-2 n=1 Tax=Phyllostomus hastatus TaxID=9423 RepID=UPI001E685327|nr:glycoprotein hormone alpha-2 [Phyllostomus hastatus]
MQLCHQAHLGRRLLVPSRSCVRTSPTPPPLLWGEEAGGAELSSFTVGGRGPQYETVLPKAAQQQNPAPARDEQQAQELPSNPFGSPALEVVPMASPRTLLSCLLFLVIAEGWGQRAAVPGCHLHPFNVTVRSDRQGTCQGSHVAQACVGHCESSAFPSRYSVLVASGYRHNVTSVSRCCTISSLRKVKVQLQCGGARREELEIFTARACQCDMCRLSRF